MALQVIGTGFGRTGTDSMREALDILGFGPCHHMRALMADADHKQMWRDRAVHGAPDWDRIFDGFGACVDWPSAQYWPELIDHYPDAKVLLTWRTAESWWESFSKTILPVVLASEDTEENAPGSKLVDRAFGWKPLERDHCIAVYEFSACWPRCRRGAYWSTASAMGGSHSAPIWG